MDRRFFLKSLLGVAGASAASALLAPKAQALPLFDELQAMDASGSNPLATAALADLPAEGASEAQYYGPPPGYYRRRPRRYYAPPPRVRRCRTFYDRWGRLVRRCWWG
jgi:hypothetical protein